MTAQTADSVIRVPTVDWHRPGYLADRAGERITCAMCCGISTLGESFAVGSAVVGWWITCGNHGDIEPSRLWLLVESRFTDATPQMRAERRPCP